MGRRSDAWAREHAWRMGAIVRSMHEKAGIDLLTGRKLLDEARDQFRYYTEGTWRGMFSAPDLDVYMEAFVASYTTTPALPKDDPFYGDKQLQGETNDDYQESEEKSV